MYQMQPSRIITVLNLALVICVSGFLDYDIIEGYFRQKFINYASIIGCFSQKEQLKITKRFLLKPMTSVYSLNKNCTKDSLETAEAARHLGVVLDGDCNEAHTFLRLGGRHKHFDEKHHWLILTSSRNVTHLFKNVEMYVNSDIQVIYPKENGKFVRNYTVQEVYRPSYGRGGCIKLLTIGFYSALDGYRVRGGAACKYWTRRNMTGVVLRTIVVLPVPFDGKLLDYLSKEDDREINTFNRFHYNLMSSCQRYYNFTADVTLSRSWGYKQKDGSFDGLVGALEREQTDYGSSPLFFRIARAEVMQYGRTTWTLRAAFVFRNPKSANSIEGFVKPLSASMWALTVASATLIVIFLRLSCLYEKKHVNQHADVTWSYFLICTIGALCQQGMTITPNFPSGRIVTLFMFVFALLIYQFYSASLVSHLLMKAPTRITTVEDILHSNMKVGCEDTLYNRDYFKYTTDKFSRKLYLGKILGKNNNSNFLSPEKGLELVREGRYAFHVELATAYPVIRNTFREKVVCELREVNLYRDQPMHANFQKGSPYKEMFDTCLQRLAEVGIITREILFWHPEKPDCIQSPRSVNFNIGLDGFYPALMVWGVGMVCSLAVLVLEIYNFHKPLLHKEKETEKLLYPFVK